MREEFKKHLENELHKYNGVAFPVKSGILHRLLTKQALCIRLHPNPDDEFSKPDVGPSFRIIGEYEHKLRNGNAF